MPKPSTKSPETEVVWMPTARLKEAFFELNPRIHTLDTDVKGLALRLLDAGWMEIGISYNEQTERLVGGHGRVEACLWLAEQDEDWFADRWEKWLQANPDRKELAHQHHDRFNAEYWTQAPVKLNRVDQTTHNAMVIALNNQAVEGKDDPKRVAALLAQLPKQFDDMAGWESSAKSAFTSAFLEKKKVAEAAEAEEEAAQTEYQNKQRFERDDATEYEEGDEPEDATAESGEVTTYYDEDEADWKPEDGEDEVYEEFRAADGSIVSIANVDTDIEAVETDVFKHSKHYADTRAVLYVSQDELQRWKAMSKAAAAVFEVDTVGEIAKIWRSKATLAAIQWAVEHHPNRAVLNEAASEEQEDAE